ncbi:S-adenosyl-L-methionine-dependent methyltransferase [Sodiomyces alkalinus F11]|uniref:S-adenosyl-L-methionine-dependent methyltransferase n=1 Tax=Sodiomyces alkalinus (strain CBS 110278 / VKM F-3762 / F11) TaxID=1314773 RepID=A0A3N2PYL9_SODAK|nr:S-adenosyl-L-methionine-dependent methyltransferase [Sodiomyces alkalinus F11]ROT39597.1 S-adenosyl-L-methionine-dependent methyltransferase [Sodiomyces alkalinus F11]
METVLASIRQLAANANEAARRQLITTLHEIAYSLEDANDTVHRYGYLHLQTAAVKTGFDLGLFRFISASEGPVTVSQIADKTGADPLFLSRFLSYLASTGAVKEVAKDEFAANNVTKNLAEKVTEAGVSHCFETIGPQYQAIPAFLKKTNYKNPSDEMHTVFQDAWKTDKHAFAWFTDHPGQLDYFNDYMAFRREPALSWLTVYPVEQETQNWDGTRPVYVNVGGGIGHQCAQFKEKYPHIPGPVILQDLPHSIAKALPTPGVENTAHNFFEPQPVRGAKFYFARGVLHNHPDHKVRVLLGNIKSAMAPDSVILLDEMVLPETGVNSYAAAMDLTMMSAFASMERSEAQWRTIIEDVGLKLVKTYPYNPVSYESVMDIRLP